MPTETSPGGGGAPAFTPPPWFATASGRSVVARPIVELPNGREAWTTKRICTFSYNDNKADVRLVVAAPDLFAALENIFEASSARNHPALCIINDMAERALAKARGEA